MMIEQNRAEFERCRIPKYHAAGKLGQGITVAVLDDNERPLPFMDYVEYPLGRFEKTKQHHSTKVIRVIHEVAPEARIISLPYINEATTQQKNDSIQWILDHRNEIDVINCSFHEWENDLFKRLQVLDIPIVCASGNQDYEDKIKFPASLSWTIAVGALEEYRDAVAGYSNEGPELDCICYTDIEIPTTKGTMRFNGTSCAASMVAGMLALAGKMTGQEAKQFIKANCIDYYEQGHDWKSGYGLFVLPELEVPNMRDINLLHPELRPKALKLIELAKSKGIDIVISQTWRTKAEQDALYAQGRTAPGSIVTNVKYPNSLHCWGLAFDVAVIINGKPSWIAAHFDQLGPLGESLGLEWGGRWQNFPDKPHFQLQGVRVADLIKRYGTPENYKKSWTEEAKTVKSLKGEDFDADAKIIFRGKEIRAGIVTLPEGGKTFVQLTDICDLLGLKYTYDNATKTVTILG